MNAPQPKHIPLPQVSSALREQYGEAPGYQTIYRAAISGYIPAFRRQNGRWYLLRDDLQTIAQTFGLI